MNLKEQLVTRTEEVEELQRLQAEKDRIEAKRILDVKMADGRAAGETAIPVMVKKAKAAADEGRRGLTEEIGVSPTHQSLNHFDQGHVQAIIDYFQSEDVGAYYSYKRELGVDGEETGRLIWSLNVYW